MEESKTSTIQYIDTNRILNYPQVVKALFEADITRWIYIVKRYEKNPNNDSLVTVKENGEHSKLMKTLVNLLKNVELNYIIYSDQIKTSLKNIVRDIRRGHIENEVPNIVCEMGYWFGRESVSWGVFDNHYTIEE